MMHKGVITVYLSLIFLIMLSFVLALLESARVYCAGTASERYADMAGEMVFSSYVIPLAEKYDLLAVDAGKDHEGLSSFETYMKMNMEENGQGRAFKMYGNVEDVSVSSMSTFRDNNWDAFLSQIAGYEKYGIGESAAGIVKDMFAGIGDSDIEDKVNGYTGTLSSDGKMMDEEIAEKEAEAAKEDSEADGNEGSEETSPDSVSGEEERNLPDPRKGIGAWLKSGLLTLTMGNRPVSGKSIDVSKCSWQTSSGGKQNVITDFEDYNTAVAGLEEQTITDRISEGLSDFGDQLIADLYIMDKFGMQGSKKDGTALDYEVEYILFGKETDRENLESTVTDIFMLRTVLNLVFLLTSKDMTAALDTLMDGLSVAIPVPAAAEVIRMLLILCWASAEGVVDCAGLTDGKKIPLVKTVETWNLSADQLLMIGQNGGNASAYVRDGRRGLNYGCYVLALLMFTPWEKKMIRMTQLMELNIRLVKGYEDFRISGCITSAEFSGTVRIGGRYTQAGGWKHRFSTYYSY